VDGGEEMNDLALLYAWHLPAIEVILMLIVIALWRLKK